jgi:phosphoribosylamine--glycine ligase
VTPGNAGIAAHGLACVTTPASELDADLFVIGPELPLVEGLADTLRAQGKAVVGPGALGARLEGSKAYMKEFLASAGVPTASFGVFDDEHDAVTFLSTLRAPYVIKTDGLAAGKGVLVTNDFDEACRDVKEKLSGLSFGTAGTTVVIEEGLEGEECSLTVLFDGEHAYALAPAQDFKRVGDANEGPNTGGMGAYAPMAIMTPGLIDEVMSSIIAPTVGELHKREIDYRGVLYAEVIAPLYGPRLFALLRGVAEGTLDESSLGTYQCAVTVVLASYGYPLGARHGDVIEGLGPDGQLVSGIDGVTVFHAGTALDDEGRFVTAGGRVLAITAVANTMREARDRAYAAASLVTFEGRVMRHDIALAVS